MDNTNLIYLIALRISKSIKCPTHRYQYSDHSDTSKAITQYIRSVYSNNRKTGIVYAKRLKNFESFFSRKYNFTLDDYLVRHIFNIDVYELLGDYTYYL